MQKTQKNRFRGCAVCVDEKHLNAVFPPSQVHSVEQSTHHQVGYEWILSCAGQVNDLHLPEA